jgi:hypothetical protein
MTGAHAVTAHLLRGGEDMGLVTLTLDRRSRSPRSDWTGEIMHCDPKVKLGLLLNPIGGEGTAFAFALTGGDLDREWPITFVSADELHNTGQVQGMGELPG